MTHLHKTLGLALALLSLSAAAQQAVRKPYIVELVDQPTANYSGGLSGLAATKPAAGQRLNVNSVAARAYSTYLDGRQTAVAAAVPSAPVLYRYKHVLNGFAAMLTDAELAKLVADPGVRAVTADVAMPMDTSYTPSFLGLTQAGGAWSRLDASGRLIKGEGVIIGHVDGGVWPENPSFSDKVDPITGKPVASHLPGTVVYDPLPAGRWNGVCQASTGAGGASFTAAHCNNKLIGARYFNAVLKAQLAAGVAKQWSGDYADSPRDADGHGTHTLSTSGGNEGVQASISGTPVTINGIAPRARVAAYRVCFVPADANDNPQQGSCYNGDSAAAIDAAVADGVDVINFSVGGSRTSVQDAVSVAFANASFAGVFVATSSGNSNVVPGNATTVAHVAPWTTTVGNSTHDRFTTATVTLGNGFTASGPSFQTAGLASKAVVLSIEAGVNAFATLGDADKLALARCYNTADRADPTLNAGVTSASLMDPAKVAGKIVVCVRGGNVLINKASAVQAGGGAGMILQNIPAGLLAAPLNAASANTVINQPYVIPTVHLAASNASAVFSYAAGGAGSASFGPAVQTAGVVAPVMADTSSRGPNQRDPSLLKPEITAPGTDILAAYTNTSITADQRNQIIAGTLIPGPGAGSLSGTSMASPHVAGAAALLKQANPTWSPYAIKSALLTSTVQNVKLANGAVDNNRWGYGAGHLNPNVALDTKSVYDQTIGDHINYYFGLINGRTLNIATLTHSNVVGTGSLTRTLTNKGASAVTYSAVASLPGFSVSVSPSQLTIPPGGSASYSVTMARTSAPIEQWQFGSVVWTGGSAPTLYSPLSAKASNIIALAGVTDTRNVGTKVYTVQFGYNGPLVTTPTGLTPATVVQSSVALDATQCFPFTVPTGAKTVRVQLFNSDTEGGSGSDLDLRVLRNGTTVGSSGNGDSEELVQLASPAAGNYQACVDGFAPVNGLAAFKLSYWVLGPTNPGTLKAFGPGAVSTSQLASVGINWNVPAGQRYLGLVEYRQTAAGSVMARTDVFIDNSPAAQAQAAFAPVYRYKVPAAD